MDKSSVYLETSILSYLAARPSRELLTAACQQVTAEWWESKRRGYDLFTSELVIAEAKSGDAQAAQSRLKLLSDSLLVYLVNHGYLKKVVEVTRHQPPPIPSPSSIRSQD